MERKISWSDTVQFEHLFLLIILGSCAIVGGCLNGNTTREDGLEFSGKGTVTLIPQYGGFFGIASDDGNRYYPLNLDDEFKVHGLRVRFSARIKGDAVTIQQWGTPVEILFIERIPNS